MKQIGLQKLGIEFHFDLSPDYDSAENVWNQNKQDRFEVIFHEIIDELLEEKAERWRKYHRNDLRTALEKRQITITLSLCA